MSVGRLLLPVAAETLPTQLNIAGNEAIKLFDKCLDPQW